jgi:hypothetical protein
MNVYRIVMRWSDRFQLVTYDACRRLVGGVYVSVYVYAVELTRYGN